MKSNFLFFLLIFFSNKNEVDCYEDLEFLDGIAVLRAGESGLSAVYFSDSWYLTPFGTKKSLSEEIIKNIWLSYGAENGIKMVFSGASNEYAEQYLDVLQEQKNVSRLKIEKMVGDLGYTMDDIKKELNNQFLINQTIETTFAARGSLNVKNSEILAYYEQNSQEQEANFKIQVGVLRSNKFIENIDDNIKKKIDWKFDPYVVLEKDIPFEFGNLIEYDCEEIFYTEFDRKKQEMIFYKLIEKNEKKKTSLDESYEEILHKIKNEKYETNYRLMTKKFLESDAMIYYDMQIKNTCLDFLSNTI